MRLPAPRGRRPRARASVPPARMPRRQRPAAQALALRRRVRARCFSCASATRASGPRRCGGRSRSRAGRCARAGAASRSAPGDVRVDDGGVEIRIDVDEGEAVETATAYGRSFAWTREAGGPAGARHRARGRPRVPRSTRARSLTSAPATTPGTPPGSGARGSARSPTGAASAGTSSSGIHDSPRCERADHLGRRRAGGGGAGRLRRRPGAILFEDGARAAASASGPRARDRTNLLVMRSYYRQPFGTFAGELPAA